MFPHGQAATIIMPIAIDAGGFNNKTKPNVNNGNKIICEIQPINTDFGLEYSVLKSSFFISIANENKMNAKHTFKTSKPSLFAFMCTLSNEFIYIF